MAASRILLGVIGRPHGVRGHVHVHSYAARPDDLDGYGPLSDGAGRRFALRWVAAGVAELSELVDGVQRPLADRTAAERLTNVQLFIDRGALPAPGEDEFYLSDLIGLHAIAQDGAALGVVTAVHDYGAGPSIEIAAPDGPLLLPFTLACVPEIDLDGGRLTAVLPDELIVEDAAFEAVREDAR